jgi:hypothetical protein
MAEMTNGDRTNLERLARKRGPRSAGHWLPSGSKALRADVEDQLSAEYEYDDNVWADITRHAQSEISKADAGLAERCQ